MKAQRLIDCGAALPELGDTGDKGDKGDKGEDGVGIKGSPGAPGAPGETSLWFMWTFIWQFKFFLLALPQVFPVLRVSPRMGRTARRVKREVLESLELLVRRDPQVLLVSVTRPPA